MIQASGEKLRSALLRWFRKGRTPSDRASHEVERRFGLGHDLEGVRIVPRYMIDRKLTIVDGPRTRDQILRQSDVLAQHRLLGMWEVPSDVQKQRALKLIELMNVTNIEVRVVKP